MFEDYRYEYESRRQEWENHHYKCESNEKFDMKSKIIRIVFTDEFEYPYEKAANTLIC